MCEAQFLQTYNFQPSSNVCDYKICEVQIFDSRSITRPTRAMGFELIFAVESFTIDSMIRGYHVYKDVWSSFIGEMLYCRRDICNHHDPFAVAI